jgi:tryptophan 2,3-dioxygenase
MHGKLGFKGFIAQIYIIVLPCATQYYFYPVGTVGQMTMEDPLHSPQIKEKLRQLEEKYAVMGQDWLSYLDGLLVANSLTYWDYIHLDTLLSLQNPRTDFPDELIFIAYHQHTELFFKLMLSEIRQLAYHQDLTAQLFTLKVERLNRYLQLLVHSFDIMTDGLDREQFQHFRMALLPASGFQSVQYRMVEIGSTKLRNLLVYNERHKLGSEASFEEMYEQLYWRQGAIEISSGEKTLTLKQFEQFNRHKLIEMAREYEYRNLWMLHRRISLEKGADAGLNEALRRYDSLLNLHWPLAHYRAAVRHLKRQAQVIEATGGTNWQQYLPPRFQRRISFPELWSEEELTNWGKQWVEEQV